MPAPPADEMGEVDREVEERRFAETAGQINVGLCKWFACVTRWSLAFYEYKAMVFTFWCLGMAVHCSIACREVRFYESSRKA